MSSDQPAPDQPPAEQTIEKPLKKGPPQPGPRQPGPRRPFPGRGNRPDNPQPAPTPAPPKPRGWGENKPNKRALDSEIEQELAEALGDAAILTALAETEQPKGTPRVHGQKRRGRIVGVHGKDVFIEVPGGRSQGVMSILQFEDRNPVIGEEVEFDVERFDSANGLLVLTREGAVQSVSDWSSVQLGMIVEARVTGLNKNKTGLLVEVNGLKGFMPISQLELHRVDQPEAYENQRLKCQVIELNPEERNLIVSRRVLLERERQQQAEQFWAVISEGKVIRGVVKTVRPFGAFVDLGGADGLIPVSEFSWQRVENLEDYIKPGQEVEVMVARVDHEARKIGLSLRALQADPFEEFAAGHRPGSRLPGKVTRIADFGAFVELAPGIEGLIHISELSTARVRKVREVVAENDEVTVQILNIDVPSRRIALSLKAVAEEADQVAAMASAAEDEAERKAALERLANRQPAANLRGGLGGGAIKFG